MIFLDKKCSHYKFLPLICSYLSSGKRIKTYTDTRNKWYKIQDKFRHIEGVRIEALVPTSEQQSRLDAINADLPETGNSEHFIRQYVEYGYAQEGSNHPVIISHANTPASEEARLNLFRERLINELAFVRYTREVNGCMYNGMPLATDRESLAHFNSTLSILESTDPEGTIDWKHGDQWMTLGVDQLRSMYQSCFTHIQKCFTAEKMVHDELMAVTDIAVFVGPELDPEDELDGDVEFETFNVHERFALAFESLTSE